MLMRRRLSGSYVVQADRFTPTRSKTVKGATLNNRTQAAQQKSERPVPNQRETRLRPFGGTADVVANILSLLL